MHKQAGAETSELEFLPCSLDLSAMFRSEMASEQPENKAKTIVMLPKQSDIHKKHEP